MEVVALSVLNDGLQGDLLLPAIRGDAFRTKDRPAGYTNGRRRGHGFPIGFPPVYALFEIISGTSPIWMIFFEDRRMRAMT
jgi:hypothetical protein